MNSVRILIADDHELVRRALRSLLESRPDWKVCAEAADGKQAVEKAKQFKPDVAVLDVSMPEMNGLEAARLIRRESPHCQILIVSQNDPIVMKKAAAEAGTQGFVQKSRISQELLGAIDALLKDDAGKIGQKRSQGKGDSAPPGPVVNARNAEFLASDTREEYRRKIARITLDSMVQFVGLLDAKGTVLEINQVALDGVGIRLSDVEEKPFWTTFWWQVSEEINATLKESIERASQGEFVRWDAEIYGRSGGKETIIIDASLMPVKNEQGQVVFITAEGRDITEKKAQEREIFRQREELAKLDEMKTQFFANISHEFRTPLTLMMGPLEDAMADPQGLSPANREGLELAHRNSLRLLKLVNTLLDFSRIEAGRIQASYEPTDLSAFTAELASVFRSAIERAGMRLIINCPALPELVFVDREMWEKVVLNLLSNAFKFTFDGEIEISVRPAGSTVEMTVRDTGTGIPAPELPKLFERFHRVENARGRSYEGSGIGLALVRELVRLHAGSVRVESEVDRGTTFTVTLPLGKDHLPADHVGRARTLASTGLSGEAYVQEALRWLPEPRDAAPDGQLPTPSSRSNSLEPSGREREQPSRILLADDNADMREYVQRLLREQYDVVAVADGEAALKSARERRPDLILSDIMMPRIDGFALLRTARADQDLKGIPVILLSARAGEGARVEGLDAGADDYLVKPFSARELLARVGSHLAIARLRCEATERERKLRAEAEMERNRIRELFMQAPSGMGWLSGPEHRWTFVNSEYLRVTRRGRAEDFIGKTIRESMPELEGQGFIELLDTVYRTGIPHVGTEAESILARIQTGREEEAYFNFIYQPMFDIEGTVEGVLIHAVEVTSQVQARREIEKRERAGSLLAAIVDSSDDAIASKDLDGTITSWNKSAEQLFGYAAAEAIGKHITLIIPPERRKEEDEILRRIRRGDRVDHFETVRVRKDGTTIDLSLTISPIRDASGRVVGASKVARDISERKLAQAELHRSQLRLAAEAEALRRSEEQLRKLSETLDTEVRARTAELEERNREMQRRAEQVRDLSWRLLRIQDEERRHIARELHDSAGQTLTVLGMGLAQLVQRAARSAPELATDAEMIQETVQQLHREIRTASYLLHPPLLDETGLRSALSWYVQGLTERSGLEITLDIAEGFGRLPHDMELAIFRLVQECLTNIHRHAESKTASIRIDRDQDLVTIEVQDEGKGMSPAKLAAIHSQGSGVGVRGMRERIRQFQGDMNIESNSFGTLILVTIPVPKAGEPAKKTGVDPLPAAL
jgi:PAS domain S-box-containing protein